eukprot:SAG31_NODE_1881_length_7000_cov_9.045646_5_plen_1007_part_00
MVPCLAIPCVLQVLSRRAQQNIEGMESQMNRAEKAEEARILVAAARYSEEQQKKQRAREKTAKEADAHKRAEQKRQETEKARKLRLEANKRRKDEAFRHSEAIRMQHRQHPAAASSAKTVLTGAFVESGDQTSGPTDWSNASECHVQYPTKMIGIDHIAEDVVAVYSNNATEARMQTVAAEQAAREGLAEAAAKDLRARASRQRKINRKYAKAQKQQRQQSGAKLQTDPPDGNLVPADRTAVMAKQIAERKAHARQSFDAMQQRIEKRLAERDNFFFLSANFPPKQEKNRSKQYVLSPWRPSGQCVRQKDNEHQALRPVSHATTRRRQKLNQNQIDATKDRELANQSQYTLIFSVAKRGAAVGNLFVRLNGARGTSRTVICSQSDAADAELQDGGSISFTFAMPWVGRLQSIAIGHHLDELKHHENTKLLIDSVVVTHLPTNARDRLPCNRWLDQANREMLLHVGGTTEKSDTAHDLVIQNRPSLTTDGAVAASAYPQHWLFLQTRAVGPAQSVLQIQVEIAATDVLGAITRAVTTVDLRVPAVIAPVEASSGFNAPAELLSAVANGKGALELNIRDVTGVTCAGQVSIFIERAVVRGGPGSPAQFCIDCYHWLSKDGFSARYSHKKASVVAATTRGNERRPEAREHVYAISFATADQSAARACRHPLRSVAPTVILTLLDEDEQKTMVHLPVTFTHMTLERFVIRLERPLSRISLLEIDIEDGDPFDRVRGTKPQGKRVCLPFKWALLSANITDLTRMFCWHSACETTLECQPQERHTSGSACRALVQSTNVGKAAAVTITVLLARGESDHSACRLLIRVRQDDCVSSAVARPVAQTTDGRRRLMTETTWLPLTTNVLPEVGVCCLPGSNEGDMNGCTAQFIFNLWISLETCFLLVVVWVDQVIIVINHTQTYYGVGDRVPSDGQTVIYAKPMDEPLSPTEIKTTSAVMAPKTSATYKLTLYFDETVLYQSIHCAVRNIPSVNHLGYRNSLLHLFVCHSKTPEEF